MTDQPTPETPNPLFQARLFLLTATNGLVAYARTLLEGSVERDTVRHAIRETSNALVRIYPTAQVDAAQKHAIRTLELRPAEGQLLEISGVTVELYADELCKWFFVNADA